MHRRSGEEKRGLRVVKLEQRKPGSFLAALRRLGRVPAAARDKRPIAIEK